MTIRRRSDSSLRDGCHLEIPLEPGTLVWARFDQGSSFWPAMVTKPTEESSEINKTFVIFFGFEYCVRFLE